MTRCTVVRLARNGVEVGAALTGQWVDGPRRPGPRVERLADYASIAAALIAIDLAASRAIGACQDGEMAHHARQAASFCSNERPAWAGLEDGKTAVLNPAASNSGANRPAA